MSKKGKILLWCRRRTQCNFYIFLNVRSNDDDAVRNYAVEGK